MPTKLTSRSAIWSIALGAAILAVLGLGVVSATDAACTSCHIMGRYSEALASSPHEGIGCGACHAHSLEARLSLANRVTWSMLPKWAGGAARVESAAQSTPSRACLNCHETILDVTSDVRGMKIVHGACAVNETTCDGCHTAASHAEATRWHRQPVMEECIECHVAQGASIECDSCHEGKLETERLRQGPWRVTHGAEWRNTHGAGTLTACRTCHPANYCVDCHGLELPHPSSFGKSHGVTSVLAGQNCETCHDRKAFCDECHGVEMPHPASFMPEHPEATDGFGDPTCLSCHRLDDCNACHVKHTHPGNTDGTLGGDR